MEDEVLPEDFFTELFEEHPDIVNKFDEEYIQKQQVSDQQYEVFYHQLIVGAGLGAVLSAFPIVNIIENTQTIMKAAYALYKSNASKAEQQEAKYNILMTIFELIPIIGGVVKKIFPIFIKKRSSQKPERSDEFFLEIVQYAIERYPDPKIRQINAANLINNYCSVLGFNKIMDKLDRWIQERLDNKDDWCPDFVWEAAQSISSFLREHLQDILKFVTDSLQIAIRASIIRSKRKQSINRSRTRSIIRFSKHMLIKKITGGIGEHIGDYAILEKYPLLRGNWESRTSNVYATQNEHGKWKESPIDVAKPGKITNFSLMHNLKAVSGATGIDAVFRLNTKSYIVAEYKASAVFSNAEQFANLKSLLRKTDTTKQMSNEWVLDRIKKLRINYEKIHNTLLADELKKFDSEFISKHCIKQVVLVSFAKKEKNNNAFNNRRTRKHLLVGALQILSSFDDSTVADESIDKMSDKDKIKLLGEGVDMGYLWHHLHSEHQPQKGTSLINQDVSIIRVPW